tara:strand:- start:3324 stop:4676 length:1353 start_codon:yes stop_codon:yes gene_type:complete
MALTAKPIQVRPTSTKTVLKTNYISLFDYSSQEAPETHDEIANIYGQQSVSGMLYMLGAEAGFASDKVIWTEEGRLHTVYNDVTRSGNVFTKAGHVFRKNETVHLSDGSTKRRGIIIAVDDAAGTFEVAPYKSAGFTALGTTAVTAFVDGSEHQKGTKGAEGSLQTDFSIHDNKPIILKDKFEVNGSDATQVGWVKTSAGGYLWYLESEKDTRRRWEDRLETSLILGERAEVGSIAESKGYQGTEGFFEAIKERGNTFQGVMSDLDDVDSIVKAFDAEGKIQDYMYYVDRDQSNAIDNLLGTLNAGHADGISYGMFDNSKDMSVNLGFKGFTRGTYNFFKTDWKLLNDPTLLGAVSTGAGKVRGALIPVGTKEVYEGEYNGSGGGSKITVPFLQSKYRVAGAENRKYKTWVTGTVGGVYTDDEDVMKVHHLSERMLCTVGANNFMLFEGA